MTCGRRRLCAARAVAWRIRRGCRSVGPVAPPSRLAVHSVGVTIHRRSSSVGPVAQYLGDGLVVYFGYPQAHENDAQRAVQAGLGMAEGIGKLHARFDQQWGVRLAVRLWIHSGVVVVGDMGGGARHEALALGE